MEWIDRLNASLDYLEENLGAEVDCAKAAQIACCSVYHYQRMFTYLAGITLTEYLRRRRMSLAAVDLQNHEKVADVALRYGYASPTAFTRTFQRVHGVTPSAVQRGDAMVKAFPPLSFKITVQGVVEMEFRIEKRGAFRVVGVSEPMAAELEQNFETVPKFWARVSAGNTLPVLASLMDSEPKGLLGICTCCGEAEHWRYSIAAASTREPPEGMEAWEIPPFTWAVFPGEGPCPQSIKELEQRIIREWLPTSGYEYADGPDLERYLTPDPSNAKFEVWIPVTRRR